MIGPDIWCHQVIIKFRKGTFDKEEDDERSTKEKFNNQILGNLREIDKISFAKRSAVIAVEDKEKINLPRGFVQLNEETDGWEKLISDTLEKALPSYSIPVKFILVEAIPLLTNGKVDYKRLQEEIKK